MLKLTTGFKVLTNVFRGNPRIPDFGGGRGICVMDLRVMNAPACGHTPDPKKRGRGEWKV